MRTIFSSDEVAALKRNPCVFSCTERSINYTYEFKKRALELYVEGVSAKEIWRRAGFDQSVVDRVCQEVLGSFSTDLFATPCLQTSLIKISRQRLIRILAGGVEFKCQLNVWSTDIVDDKRFGLLIIHIPERCVSGEPATLYGLLETFPDLPAAISKIWL